MLLEAFEVQYPPRTFYDKPTESSVYPVTIGEAKPTEMKEVVFTNWPERLAQASLSDRQKKSFNITIRWYQGVSGRLGAGPAAEREQPATSFECRGVFVARGFWQGVGGFLGLSAKQGAPACAGVADSRGDAGIVGTIG